eukprot:13794874-Ditylum_brightwellii.AAC.1
MEGLGLAEVMLLTWILQKCALDRSKLVTWIEKGPRGVHFFCTNEEKKDKMTAHIDLLGNIMRSQFGYEAYNDTTNGEQITRKFWKKEWKNAGEAAQAFTQFLSSSPATGNKYAD